MYLRNAEGLQSALQWLRSIASPPNVYTGTSDPVVKRMPCARSTRDLPRAICRESPGFDWSEQDIISNKAPEFDVTSPVIGSEMTLSTDLSVQIGHRLLVPVVICAFNCV